VDPGPIQDLDPRGPEWLSTKTNDENFLRFQDPEVLAGGLKVFPAPWKVLHWIVEKRHFSFFYPKFNFWNKTSNNTGKVHRQIFPTVGHTSIRGLGTDPAKKIEKGSATPVSFNFIYKFP
jgi:hypothetical protein